MVRRERSLNTLRASIKVINLVSYTASFPTALVDPGISYVISWSLILPNSSYPSHSSSLLTTTLCLSLQASICNPIARTSNSCHSCILQNYPVSNLPSSGWSLNIWMPPSIPESITPQRFMITHSSLAWDTPELRMSLCISNQKTSPMPTGLDLGSF